MTTSPSPSVAGSSTRNCSGRTRCGNHSVYGSYGISVFAARDASVDELAQQAPLVRFAQLTLMTVGALRSAGLRLEPTGRNPRHFDIAFDHLDEGITRLLGCEHRTVVNPYHED